MRLLAKDSLFSFKDDPSLNGTLFGDDAGLKTLAALLVKVTLPVKQRAAGAGCQCVANTFSKRMGALSIKDKQINTPQRSLVTTLGNKCRGL